MNDSGSKSPGSPDENRTPRNAHEFENGFELEPIDRPEESGGQPFPRQERPPEPEREGPDEEPSIEFKATGFEPTAGDGPSDETEEGTERFDDDQGIPFRRAGDEEAYGEPEAGEASVEEPAESAAASEFQIEGYDEELPAAEGHIFAEVPAEPPPQPFEIVREVRSPAAILSRKAKGERTGEVGTAGRIESAPPPLYVRLFWGFMPILLLLLGYGAVIFTQDGIGYAWDEAYYYEPALDAADWLLEALRGTQPFGEAAIERYWSERHEHPSFQKVISGLACRGFADPQKHLWAMRFPIAVLFGLTLSLIYMLGRRSWGVVPGLLAALVYLCLPRIFGHAHFASMETPLVFSMLLVVFCFLRGLESWTWALVTGLSFGLLLATKLNGFFLPIPLILWAHLYARRRYVNNLFAMIFLGPVVWVALWPWLWHDTLGRIIEYLAFHVRHQQTALYFMGEVWGYGRENAPWFYPLTMVAVTLPVSALVLIVYGVLRTLARPHRRPNGALFLLCALVMLGVASAPGTPKYDGVRLFLPVFPFLALMAGSGLVGIMKRVDIVVGRRIGGDRRRHRIWRRTVLVGILGIVVLEGGGVAWRYHPYLLSYFNPLVGGLKGAQEKGFEWTYWGEALNTQVLERLNQLPPGSSIYPMALHEKCLQHHQQWGNLAPHVNIGGPPPYDYHLLLMRPGFFGRTEWALVQGPFHPIADGLWRKFGVPMIAIYRTGPAFEVYWRRIGLDQSRHLELTPPEQP